MSDSLSSSLAAWSNALRWRDVPAEQRGLVRMRVLDTLGLMLRGSHTEATAAARAVAMRSGGAGPSSAAGAAAGLPPGWAALVNGVAAHCWDFDDTFPESVVHPGSAIVPVALAVAEAEGVSGEDACTAIVAGYEIAARLAAYGGKRFHARGFHASAIFAPVVAAFVAARLYQLDAVTSASAVGLAASMSGGLLAFLPDGTWSKWLHLGWGNLGGVTAAQLASEGFRGPVGALDGRHNLYEAFIAENDVDAATILAELGTRWDNATSVFKFYPCAHVIQGYIDGALALRSHLSSPVIAVECRVAPWAMPIVAEPRLEKIRPRTTMHAIASLPLHVASALLNGAVGIETIEPANYEHPVVLALTDKVVCTPDESLERFDARLTITTADGVTHAYRGAVAGADDARMRSKFEALAAGSLPSDAIVNVMRDVERLPERDGVGGLTVPLRG